MKEVSIRAALDERRVSHPEQYQKLEELLNLQRPDRYGELTATSLGGYQHLRSAGFSSDSLFDQLTTGQIKRLYKALKLDASRVFVQQDLDYVVRTYGLRFYTTRLYRGKAYQAMEADLRAFQQTVLDQNDPQWYESNYSVLGVAPALTDHPVATSRIPLLFFHLGAGFYFLVSTYESWVSGWRSLVYWPFATYRHGMVAGAVYVAIFMMVASLVDQQTLKAWLIPIIYPYILVFILGSAWPMLRPRSIPDGFPRFLNRIFYRLLPY